MVGQEHIGIQHNQEGRPNLAIAMTSVSQKQQKSSLIDLYHYFPEVAERERLSNIVTDKQNHPPVDQCINLLSYTEQRTKAHQYLDSPEGKVDAEVVQQIYKLLPIHLPLDHIALHQIKVRVPYTI